MVFNLPTPAFLRRNGSSSSIMSLSKDNSLPSTISSSSSLTKITPDHTPAPNTTTTPNTTTFPSIREQTATPPPISQPLPKLNTHAAANTPPSSTPLSPRSRQLSDRVRAAPSSLVRQLRSYSNSISSFSYLNDNSDPFLNASKLKRNAHRNTVSGQELLRSNKAVMDNLPPELAPIVTLINAQKLRTYAVGTFSVPAIDEHGHRVWIEVEGKLTGNELAIWRPSDEEFLVDMADEFKPRYINLTDAKLEWGASSSGDYDLKILQHFNELFLIKFNNPQDLYIWSAAICLSNYEYTSLNEAYTAVMLLLKGSKLSDIHILLSQRKRFAKNEWCDIRIPQISSKWLRVYVSIIPLEGKKKNGRIEVYLNEKTNKKNLILYVNRLHDIYNIYPELPSMIDLNSIMKLDGEVFINKSYESFFEHENGASNTLYPPPSRASSFAFKSHLRSNSSSSLSSQNGHAHRALSHSSTTNSFFNNAPSPKQEPSPQLPSSPTSQHGMPSLSSSFFKKEASKFAQTNCMYLMPVHHASVPAIETMIRNFIEIIDAFKLYGRPSHLISDKFNKLSMLFGLPSLPHYKYLSMAEAVELTKLSYDMASRENWENYDWRCVYKDFLNAKQQKNGFKGHGDILKLYKTFDNLEISDADYGISNLVGTSPRILLPEHQQIEKDLVLDIYGENLSQPSYDQLNLHASASEVTLNGAQINNSGAGLGQPLEFGSLLSANIGRTSLSPSPDPYYQVGNPPEFAAINPNPFGSSPLRPSV